MQIEQNMANKNNVNDANEFKFRNALPVVISFYQLFAHLPRQANAMQVYCCSLIQYCCFQSIHSHKFEIIHGVQINYVCFVCFLLKCIECKPISHSMAAICFYYCIEIRSVLCCHGKIALLFVHSTEYLHKNHYDYILIDEP